MQKACGFEQASFLESSMCREQTPEWEEGPREIGWVLRVLGTVGWPDLRLLVSAGDKQLVDVKAVSI